jgi:hypothetical protein
MPQVVTAIDIAASPARVWEVLSDTARYAEWNPLIRDLRGDMRKGGKIRGRLHLESRKSFPFDAELTRFEPNEALSWVGPSLKPARFFASGEHFFEIKDVGNGRSRFFHGEKFGGILFGVESVWQKVGPEVEKLYGSFNEALKARVEAA